MRTIDIERDAFLLEVQTAVNALELPRAYELARTGLDRGIQHPLLFQLRADALEKEGRSDEALAILYTAQKLFPREPRIHNAIGESLLKRGRHKEALAELDTAIALDPSLACAHYNRGFAVELFGMLEEAEQCYRHAAALDVAYADPLARLAAFAAQRSEWGNAHSLADRALALDPGHSIAIFAHVKSHIEENQLDEAERWIQAILNDARKDVHERAVTQGLLGDIRDKQGRTAEAFDAYTKAHELLRQFYAPKYENPEKASTPDLVSRLMNYFESIDQDLWARRNPAKPLGETEAAGLVFIVGYPRSGTTLLGQILASHPGVVTLEERLPLVDSIRDFMEDPAGLDRLARLDEDGLSQYRDAYWRHVVNFGMPIRDKIVVDKRPMNQLWLPLIAKLFPNAKILLSIRDPRDTVFSSFRRLLVIHAFTYEFLTLEGTARLFDSTMRLTELYRAKLPLDVLGIKNEALVADFEEQTRAICQFIDIPWDKSMRNFAAQSKRRMIGTPSAPQVARGLNSEGVGQWRRYAEQMAPVLPILAPWVEKFGYPKV